MAIKFYGAKLLENGSVQGNKFVEFNIPIISKYYQTEVYNGIAPNFVSNIKVEKDKIDEPAINWIEAFLEVFGRTLSDDNSDLKGEEITFFNEPNVNSDKLGFTFKLLDMNSKGEIYSYRFGRAQNGIGMLIDINKGYKLIFCQNPTTGASTFSELLANEETFSANVATAGGVRNLLSADNMLFAPYYYSDNSTYIQYLHNRAPFTGTDVNEQRAGLMSFNNWYTMITGQYRSKNVVRLKLAVPQKGLEYIDLSLPIYIENMEAKMYTLDTQPFPEVLPYRNYTSLECQYGTDLLYLLDNLDVKTTHTIQLQNGYIEFKYDKVYAEEYSANAWVINLHHDDAGLIYATKHLYSFEHVKGNPTYRSAFGNTHGIYLMCPPEYANSNPSSWGNLVGELEAPYLYEYPNAPLCFFSEIYNLPYSSTGLEYKGTSSTNLFPVFTTNFRDLSMGTIAESLASSIVCYATGVTIDKAWWKSFLAGAIPRREINVGDGSIGGGISGSGGGDGSFDDSSDNNTSEGIFGEDAIIIPNTISKIPNDFKIEVGQMYTLLYMDDAGIVQLAETLWKDSFLDYIKSKFNIMEPASIIMSVKLLPYFPGIDGNNLKLQNLGGFVLDNPIICREAYAYTHYDAGEINIEGYFDCFLDYTNTRIQLFLPFVGDVELSTSDVMNHTINLRASFDNMAGIVVYMLTDENNNIVGSWNARCTVDIPITSGDYTGKIDGMIQAAVQAGAMAMTAGASSVVFAGTTTETANVMGTGEVSQASTRNTGEFFNENANTTSNALSQYSKVVGNALSTKPGSGTSSSYSGIAGVLSHLRPCIKITSNKSPLPADYKEIQGYPSNVSVQLSECEGYTEINTVHLENMGYATEEEIEEIEEFLKRGVIF